MNKTKKARIKTGSSVFQDRHFMRWTDNGEIFDVMGSTRDSKVLMADGYGNLDKPNSYGNGKLYVKKCDLIYVECDEDDITVTEPYDLLCDIYFCPPNCRYLKPTENDQTSANEAHQCLRYQRIVYHDIYHPRLVRTKQCQMCYKRLVMNKVNEYKYEQGD